MSGVEDGRQVRPPGLDFVQTGPEAVCLEKRREDAGHAGFVPRRIAAGGAYQLLQEIQSLGVVDSRQHRVVS